MTSQVWVDDRYKGTHGIGRYASEVLSRLNHPWQSLGLSGKPGSPSDMLVRARERVGNGIIYSPGYAAFPARVPQLLTLHDLIHLQVRWPHRAKYLAYYESVVRRAVVKAGVVLTVSETSREAISEWLGSDQVTVVNAGIGVSPVFAAGGARHVADHPYIVYVGNMRAHKNVDVVLRALSVTDDLRLYAVVPSAERRILMERSATLGIEERVMALSGLEDETLATYYRGAVATVMPSTLEGFGLPALESIMSGTPVIYWDGCRAVAETVGAFGIAVSEARDPAGWSAAIRRISGWDPPSLGAARVDYDWNRTAGIVKQTIEALT